MPALAVTIAPPGGGKSTWLAARFTPTQIVNLDTLRAWVSDDPADQGATFDAVRIQQMLLGMRCYRRLLTAVDSTNVRADVRAELLEFAARNLMLPVAVVLDTPLEVCLARNAGRPRPVPEDVIVKMYTLMYQTIPAQGPVDGFAVTRRIGLSTDEVFGGVSPPHQDAVWLR